MTKTIPVDECCVGYGATLDGDECRPICSPECKHGLCIAPNQCKCETGYGGPACDISELIIVFFSLRLSNNIGI